MSEWITELNNIASLDPRWKEKARKRLNEQTRPQGSLGVLESLLERLAAIEQKEVLSVHPKRIFIFAADHGVASENVSLYPREVTQAMVMNFLNGKATVNALARQVNAEVKVVNVGVDADFESAPMLIQAPVNRGTKNMTMEEAMTEKELEQAITIGWNLVKEAKAEGIKMIGLGEMGIANTTAASAVNAALTGMPVESMTGRGTGLNDEMLEHKVAVIQRAFARHREKLTDPVKILQCVGGFEIAAMTGAILAAARYSIPVVVDGWIVAAAVLSAVRLNPKVQDYLFFAHLSEERGHRAILEMLETQPILNLSMRLGEGSGSALAMGILEAAVRVYNEVATFAEAAVAGPKATAPSKSAADTGGK